MSLYVSVAVVRLHYCVRESVHVFGFYQYNIYSVSK